MQENGRSFFTNNGRLIRELNELPDNVKKYYDLKDVLAKWNSVTQYYVHVSRFNKWDYRRALYLKDTPGITIRTHPFFSHGITSTLAKDNRLSEYFEVPYSKENKFVYGYYFVKTITMRYFKRVFGIISRRIIGR